MFGFDVESGTCDFDSNESVFSLLEQANNVSEIITRSKINRTGFTTIFFIISTSVFALKHYYITPGNLKMSIISDKCRIADFDRITASVLQLGQQRGIMMVQTNIVCGNKRGF